jgi:hypothetical protein
MKKMLSLCILVAFLILFSCAGTKPPALIDSERAAIGICVKTSPPVSIFGAECADMVYFIKVNDVEDLGSAEYCIQSNYKKGDQIYLLNAKPGRYSVVASYLVKSTPLAPTVKYTTIFAKDIIELAQKDVQPGKMVFMGEYIINQSSGISDDADDAQLHYIQIIAPGESTGWLGGVFSGQNYYEGSLNEEKCDKQTEYMFLKNAKKQFDGTGWVALIQKSLDDLKTSEH